MIQFKKYHGTGNDFILIDDRKTLLDILPEEIRKMCDRHFGIGADGLIQIRNKTGVDFEMLYFNSDGLPGSMCGNGGRCAVAFAHALGMIKEQALFIAFDGPHNATIISENPPVVRLNMSDVNAIENHPEYIYLNTGSPHYVVFVDDVAGINVVSEGRKIRYNDRFKKAGTNVNFVQVNNGELNVRTYERGVEDETLSCGTGVTASVIAAALSGRIPNSECKVNTPGGALKVNFKNNAGHFIDVKLEGKAEMVFKGELKL